MYKNMCIYFPGYESLCRLVYVNTAILRIKCGCDLFQKDASEGTLQEQ